MTIELKACPCCGGEAEWVGVCPYVRCKKCLICSAHHSTREQAVAAWNQRVESEWQPIETAPKDGRTHIDLWMHIHASPKSMGFSDEFRVIDCWWNGEYWVHENGRRLDGDYITHWMPLPKDPQ